ncbi:MAG: N-acetylmuramoyl-L-alanine amidase [Deltaproteobacteria bacterium]|nr:N-acetylmuramoyl-L-alanine amidase [Deltaproteobacteria bacterium]
MILLLYFLGEMVLSLAPASAANKDYLQQAKDCSRRLYRSKNRMKYRDQWLRCIQAYEKYYRMYPSGRQADEALYATARLYKGLYGYSRLSSDLKESIRRFREVVKRFSKSRFADDAQYQLGEIYRMYKQDLDRAYVEYFKVVMYFPQGDMKPRAQKRLAELEARMGKRKSALDLPELPDLDDSASGRLARVTDIRHWSAQDYTRIVIDVDAQVEYASHLLRRDPSLGKPPRLYIDLENSSLDSSFAGAIPIGDGLLRKVRAGQYKPRVVRVVLDIESIEDHKIFSLSDPFRIVIDVTGESRIRRQPPAGKGKAPSLTLAQQLGLGVRKVVIDPGHGGKDPGAVGPSGVKEKDVVLEIAKRLQEKIKAKLNLDAILTRSSDEFLPLEERTALANTQKADLFVSIHTNAHKNRRIYGISTYILNVATDEEAARLAAFENAVSAKRISDLEKILNDLMLNSKINESSRLADAVQQGLIQGLPRAYSNIKDLGVKQAPFYVLIGAQMPSIMVEISFITNGWEEKRLASAAYQEAVAEGILTGIKSYIRQIETVPGRG